MFGGFRGWVVPLEVVVAVFEVDVVLVEDGGPLEGCGWEMLESAFLITRSLSRKTRRTMLSLASGAMAQLAV